MEEILQFHRFSNVPNGSIPFVQRFFRHVTSSRRIILLPVIGLLALGAKSNCPADQVTAGPNSWGPDGHFCFRSFTETNGQIHLARYSNGKIEELFVKDIETTVQFPICLSNGVVAVSADGVIHKWGLDGHVTFAVKLAGFVGASGLSGRLNQTCIFMTETRYDASKKDWRYILRLLEVSGTAPVMKAEFDIVQPHAITRAGDDIVVIGHTNTQRLELPKDCRY